MKFEKFPLVANENFKRLKVRPNLYTEMNQFENQYEKIKESGRKKREHKMQEKRRLPLVSFYLVMTFKWIYISLG